MTNQDDNKELFHKLRKRLMMFDPVRFVETYLTLDGKPFSLTGSGYRPFAEVYRYVGIKALEPTSKPIIIVAGRQVGKTTMCSALEMYFMGSGLFGDGFHPPIRVMHAFPFLELAAAYSKTKLNTIISGSIPAASNAPSKPGAKVKSHMQSLLDQTAATNDSLHFKQFQGGNHLWIESIGTDGDRVMGRQLSLETELPTPTGFIKLKDLKKGDRLFDEKGDICRVTKLHPINLSPEAYEITFDDGTKVEACADHLWLTYNKNERHKTKTPSIKNTKEILETLKIGTEKNHSIPNCLPLNYPAQDLPLDPYLFGLWLGDGDRSGSIESADPIIFLGLNHHVQKSSIGKIGSFSPRPSKSCKYRVVGLTTALTKIGRLRNTHSGVGDFYRKHIPEMYMRGSFDRRLALVRGLMDTDGHCDKNGNVEFVQVREELTKQVFELVKSLGIKAHIYKRESWRYKVRYRDKYRIRFRTQLPIFRMPRKLARIKTNNDGATRYNHRFIKEIKPIQSVPMRCVTVDSPSHLFLITRSFIPTHNTTDVIFFDEIQRMTSQAIGNSLKILTAAKYGRPSKGVQVYLGTPRRKGSDYHKMWQVSSQQYYHLGCEKCKEHFPLYTPGSDDWEKIWIHGFVVKCPLCNHEQNKLEAQERGKWIALKDTNDEDCLMVGFHLNQLYMPMFSREDIDSEKPGIHPTNTERTFQNEVLGEFFQGDSSPITQEEIREFCGDIGRKFSPRIEATPGLTQQMAFLGIDYGARADLEQMTQPDKIKSSGQSYSTAVVLLTKGPGLLSIEFATKFKRNDPESKRGIIERLIRQYNIQLAIGDIGFSNDFSYEMHQAHGDRYLVSRAHNKVNDRVKFNADAFPKEIVFERDYYIGELYEQMKKGMIRFPYGDYEKIAWLIDHCASMELKPSISRMGGDPSIHYVKGGTPNDGFMALLNAYLAYKFMISKGFTNHNPLTQTSTNTNRPLIMTGFIPRRF